MNCVFDAPESGVIDHSTGKPGDENIADSLIENDFWGGSGVCASDDDGEWFLVGCEFEAARFTLAWFGGLSADITSISFQELCQ